MSDRYYGNSPQGQLAHCFGNLADSSGRQFLVNDNYIEYYKSFK